MACEEENCCNVPICLDFICASASDDFKEQVKEIFVKYLLTFVTAMSLVALIR